MYFMPIYKGNLFFEGRHTLLQSKGTRLTVFRHEKTKRQDAEREGLG